MATHKRAKSQTYWWESLSDEELLDQRFCDLELELRGTTLEVRTQKLTSELQARGFVFTPHFWLAAEWFAPEGVPGIALPFYLAHSRLARLERRMVYEVEGRTEAWCLKILRHETGHAIDTAYGLCRRKRYRELFGRATKNYPEHYTPKPYSRNFVLHLDLWYAQAHPVEDFAETFAVWLGAPKMWRKRYKGWRALRKLIYMDELMEEIRDLRPKVRSRAKIDPLPRVKTTLREHYEAKRARYGLDDKAFYDRELRRLFPSDAQNIGQPASTFLRKNRKELRTIVARWTGEYPYTIDEILEQMIVRAQELKLRAVGRENALFVDALSMLSVQVTNALLSGTKGIPL